MQFPLVKRSQYESVRKDLEDILVSNVQFFQALENIYKEFEERKIGRRKAMGKIALFTRHHATITIQLVKQYLETEKESETGEQPS